MREVEFRGYSDYYKRFIYGYLEIMKFAMDKDEYVIRSFSDWGLNITNVVDPRSVGEYTGLKDRNSKKIFEGDIYRVGSELVHELVVVKWRDDLHDDEGYLFASGFGFSDPLDEIVVIGNIYQNKDLLK